MGFDWKKSKAHLLLLSRFIHASQFEDYLAVGARDFWKIWLNNELGEPSSKAIKRFVDEGMLMAAELNDLLSYKHRVPELKDMLKQRSLPVSGRKEELIQRLVQADPNGMRNVVAGLTLLKCTRLGREMVEQYLVAEKEKLGKVERQVMEYLAKRKLREASLTVADYEAEQVFPRGIGMDWNHHNPNHDIEVLNTIFESKPPKILGSLGNEKLEPLRIAVAMMALWGENAAKKWLPANFDTGLSFENDTTARMFLFYAEHRATLKRYRSERLEFVEVFPAPDACESCKKLAAKHYRLDEAPELPNPNCTGKMGCRCCFLPVT